MALSIKITTHKVELSFFVNLGKTSVSREYLKLNVTWKGAGKSDTDFSV